MPGQPHKTSRNSNLAGVLTRIAQRLLAMATGIWHNWTTALTSKQSLTAYDH